MERVRKARITAWGITNAQVNNEPQSATVNNQNSEAITHTGKGEFLIASKARPS